MCNLEIHTRQPWLGTDRPPESSTTADQRQQYLWRYLRGSFAANKEGIQALDGARCGVMVVGRLLQIMAAGCEDSGWWFNPAPILAGISGTEVAIVPLSSGKG